MIVMNPYFFGLKQARTMRFAMGQKIGFTRIVCPIRTQCNLYDHESDFIDPSSNLSQSLSLSL